MWNFWHKEERLKEALRYRGVDPEAMSVGKLMVWINSVQTNRPGLLIEDGVCRGAGTEEVD